MLPSQYDRDTWHLMRGVVVGIRFFSVGIVPCTLPFTASSTSIRYLRQAISLDERRAKFKANYHLQRPDDQKSTKHGEVPRSNQGNWLSRCYNKHHQRHHKDKVLSDEEYGDDPTATDVLEVWFAVYHSGDSPRLNGMYSVSTSFFRHCWRISPEWDLEQLGKNPTSLDDPQLLTC